MEGHLGGCRITIHLHIQAGDFNDHYFAGAEYTLVCRETGDGGCNLIGLY